MEYFVVRGDNDALERQEELHTFDRDAAFLIVADTELLRLVHYFPECRVSCREILRLGKRIFIGFGEFQETVHRYGFLSFKDADKIVSIEFPTGDDALQRVDGNGVLDGLHSGTGIGIARYGRSDRCEGY